MDTPPDGPPGLRPESANLATYVRIMDALRAAILGGQYPPGTRLPGRRVLAHTYGVAPMTVGQAFAELERIGAVDARRGAGTFVTADAPAILATNPDPVTFDEQLAGMRAVISGMTRSVEVLAAEVRELRAEIAGRRDVLVPGQRDNR